MDPSDNAVFTKKNLATFLSIGILLLAIPFGVTLLERQQLLKSRADRGPVIAFSGDGVTCNAQGESCETIKDTINIDLNSPLGPSVGIGYTGPTPTLTITPTGNLSPTPTPIGNLTPTPTSAQFTWNLTINPCPTGITQTASARVTYAFWPPSPLNWISDSFTLGAHTVAINGSTAATGANVYVLLENEQEKAIGFSGSPPHAAMEYGTFFNPPTTMARWARSAVPSGNYTFNFTGIIQGSDSSICQSGGSTATPTPSPSPTTAATATNTPVPTTPASGTDGAKSKGYIVYPDTPGQSCVQIAGWSCDTDKPTASLLVDIWDFATPSAPAFIGSITANQDYFDGTDLRSQCGHAGTKVNHGFMYTLPASLKNNTAHKLRFFGINIDSNGNRVDGIPAGVRHGQLTILPTAANNEAIFTCTP